MLALSLSPQLYIGAIAIGLFAAALWRSPWRRWLNGHPDRQHVWGMGLLLTAIISSLRIDAAPGLSLQLLVVTSMTLMHGWELALVASGLVLAVSCGLHGVADLWSRWPTYFLCDVALPAAFITLLNRQLSRRLPKHYAVYFFGTVFAGSIAAFMLSGAAKLALVASLGTLPTDAVIGDYEVLLLMLGFAQGTINGIVMSSVVIFHPEWVSSFDSEVYFRR